ncbi:MAG: hypothetical protein K6F89_06320 [Prevotella sp.]|nr:hypothetical protein [Prevotella sp.]
MKKVNNSQPLAVATIFRPLNSTQKIVAYGGMAFSQFYRQTSNEWVPDHTKAIAWNTDGTQKDGPLHLRMDYSIDDPDNKITMEDISPLFFWFVDDVQIMSEDPTADFYLMDNDLFVRKNYTHLTGASITCEVRFTDPRTSQPVVLSATETLSAALFADEQWAINILCDRTRKHYPLHAASTIYDFEAEARLGKVDKSDEVAWFWDWSDDQGQTWKTIDDTCFWYVSGKNSKTLRIDADYIESLMVRVRIGVANGTETAAVDKPNEATASIAWRWPKILPQVVSYGGNRVTVGGGDMRFGLLVHVPKHNDMTQDEQRHWLLCNWQVRRQGSTAAPSVVGCADVEVMIPHSLLYSESGQKLIPDPQVGMRGTYDAVSFRETGELIELSFGETFAIRT